MTDWPELCEQLKQVVNMRRRAGCGVDEIAAAIPLHPATLYRLVGGDIQKPSLPTHSCVEKFVRRASQLRRPENEES